MKTYKPSKSEWLSLVADSNESTFFQTPMWYGIWALNSNIKIETICFHSENVKAILPLFSKRKKWYQKKRFYASPQGTYGGIIWLNKVNNIQLEYLEKYLHNLNALTIHSNPYQLDQKIKYKSTTPKETHILEIERLGQKLTVDWSPKHKASLKKAKSNKLEITESYQLHEWKAYSNLYKEIVDQRGDQSSNNYTEKLFVSIFNLEPQYRKLLLVKSGNQLLCGGIFFIYKKRMFYWHGASSKEGKVKCAAFALIEFALQIAIENQCQVFDFLPSGGNIGVKHFKKGFGTKIISCPQYHIG